MVSAPHTLQAVNTMTVAEFVAVFGNIAEHAPWVADRAAADRPFASRDAMVGSFRAAIDNADRSAQHALLRAHPDLAGKAAIAGDLTAASKSEQAGAGLDRLTPEEFERFTDFNRRYRERFGFRPRYTRSGGSFAFAWKTRLPPERRSFGQAASSFSTPRWI